MKRRKLKRVWFQLREEDLAVLDRHIDGLEYPPKRDEFMRRAVLDAVARGFGAEVYSTPVAVRGAAEQAA